MDDRALARQMRLVAVVLIATIVAWVLVQAIGADYGWPPKYAFLADLAAAAGFLWAMITAWRIWRASRT